MIFCLLYYYEYKVLKNHLFAIQKKIVEIGLFVQIKNKLLFRNELVETV